MSKWQKLKLGDICEILDSQRIPVTAANRKAGIYPYYGANGVQDYVNGYIFDDELVLLAEDGGNFGSKDRPIAYRVSGKCWVNNHAHVLKPKAGLNVDYLCYSLMFYDVSDIVNGATRQKLNQAAMRKMQIPLPPLEEQKRIADILDKASNLIDLRKQQLEKMDLLIKSKFIDMFGDPVTNPKGWDMKKISDVCIINPRKTELGSIPDDLEVSFIPMASVSEKGDIRTNEIKKYSEVKTGFTYFHEGDVLFAKITPCMENGKGAIAINLKNLIGFGSTEFHVIRPIENITNSEWIFNLIGFKWLREDAEKNMTGSAGQRRVPASYFEKCKVSVPPLELQTQFAEFVEQVEKQKAVMQQSLEKMETNYKALMQEYFG